MKPTTNFQLGSCIVNPLESNIQFSGQEKKTLQPKFIEVLHYLAKEYPRLVAREELIEKIWLDNHPVGEKALTNAVWHLRKNLTGAFDDQEQEVIETIRKVGYRLLLEPIWIEQQSNESKQIKPIETAAENEPRLPVSKIERLSQLSLLSWLTSARLWLVVVLFASAFFIYQQQSSPLGINNPIQVTTSPGSELFAAPSPDGHFVVYKWNAPDGNSNLYMKDVQQLQSTPIQLTDDNHEKGHVVFSLDGQHIYFSQEDMTDNRCQLIKLNVNSKQRQVLTECPVIGGYYYLSLSADGNTLAYQGQSSEFGRRVYLLDLTDLSASPQPLRCSSNCNFRDRDIAFAPDGEHIAVTQRRNRFSENIYLRHLTDGSNMQLTQGEADIVGLTWHPGGDLLVYATQQSDVRRGYILNIHTKQRQALNIDGFSFPAFAQQSGQLFFQQRSEKYHVARFALNETVATAPFPLVQSEFNHHHPHYSPQADAIAYVSNESGHYELWLTDIAGKSRTQLTHSTVGARYPRWSHDGKKIAFLAPLKGQMGDKVHIIDIETQQVSVVKSPFARHNRPSWSLDDSAVISAIYDTATRDLYQIDIASGQTKRLTFDGGRFGLMSATHGLLYTRVEAGLFQLKPSQLKTSQSKIALQQSSQIVQSDIFNSRYSWTLAGNGVYFQHDAQDHQQLMLYKLDQAKHEVLMRLAKQSLKDDGPLSYHSASDSLIFTYADRPQADIKMIELD